nr:PREDICTED: uncharacterized protein LOC109034382 [Bemisia tabaci]
MGGCDGWAFLKLVELILCIICLLYKKWSDEEASRLFYINEKASAEWPLLNKVTWGEAGSLFADITYGSYVIITFALLIGHCVGELQHSHRMETILMGLGALLFIGVGCLEICGVDLLQHELVDNAIILGILSIVTGMIFLSDIGTITRRNGPKTVNYQTQNLRLAHEKSQGKHAAFVPEKPAEVTKVEVVTTEPSAPHGQTNGHYNGHVEDHARIAHEWSREANAKEKVKNARNKEISKADIVISNPMQTASYPVEGTVTYGIDQPDYEVKARSKSAHVANGYPMAGMVPMGELRSSLRKRMERQEQHGRRSHEEEKAIIEMDLRKIEGTDLAHRRGSITDSYASEKDHTHSTYYESKEHTKIVSRPTNLRFAPDRSRSPQRFRDPYYDASFRGLSREKRHLSKSMDDNLSDLRAQSPTVTSSQKTPPGHSPQGRGGPEESSDESVTLQLPSVSYLLADRGKKVQPTLAHSPLERVADHKDHRNGSHNTDKYYYGAQQTVFNPPAGDLKSSPKSPRDPGYVLHTASKWPTATVTESDSKVRWSVNARTQNMR